MDSKLSLIIRQLFLIDMDRKFTLFAIEIRKYGSISFFVLRFKLGKVTNDSLITAFAMKDGQVLPGHIGMSVSRKKRQLPENGDFHSSRSTYNVQCPKIIQANQGYN